MLCQSECAYLHITVNMVVVIVKRNENTYQKRESTHANVQSCPYNEGIGVNRFAIRLIYMYNRLKWRPFWNEDVLLNNSLSCYLLKTKWIVKAFNTFKCSVCVECYQAVYCSLIADSSCMYTTQTNTVCIADFGLSWYRLLKGSFRK